MGSSSMESMNRFREFIAGTGHTYVFNDQTSVQGVGILLQAFQDMGLDPMNTAELKAGMMSLFHIQLVNLPDLDGSRLILAPNHVSDLDALILGLLHPRIRIVAKNAWTNNEALNRFLKTHYDLHGLDRTSLPSLRRLLSESIRYFNSGGENKHFLVFSQGTISDFNHNSPERISTIAQKISCKTGVPVVCVFLEQASLDHPTRIVFDRPISLSHKEDFRGIWLERQAAMQNALVPPARMPKLSHKHANNNKPGDPFF